MKFKTIEINKSTEEAKSPKDVNGKYLKIMESVKMRNALNPQ